MFGGMGKIGQKIPITGKFAFFFKNFVFYNLLGPKEMIL